MKIAAFITTALIWLFLMVWFGYGTYLNRKAADYYVTSIEYRIDAMGSTDTIKGNILRHKSDSVSKIGDRYYKKAKQFENIIPFLTK